MRKILLLFLFLTSVCLGNIEIAEDVTWYNSGRDFFFSISASESMSESISYIFPPDGGAAGQAMLTNGGDPTAVMSWGTPTTSAEHDLGSTTHDATTFSATRGSIIFGNATPLWDELTVGTALGGTATGFFSHDGTDVGNRTLAETRTDLGFDATSDPSGASLIGIEDSMDLYIATDVEAALEEVKDLVTVVVYAADSIVTLPGGLTVGSVSDIQTINDGNVYTITETNGAPNPNFTTVITFTGIGTGHEANKIQLHYSYDGSAGHTINLEIENDPYDDSVWDSVDTFIDTSGVLTFLDVDIPGTITDYNNSGTTKIRIIHNNPGTNTHDFVIDYAVILDDPAGMGGITDHGQLSGLADNDHTQYPLAATIDNIDDVDTTGAEAPSQNQVLKWNGNTWVPGEAGNTDEFTFSINTFTDNEATTQLIGTGVFETAGSITFDATYLNGPPSAATVTITSNDGGYSAWGTNPLVMDSPFAQKVTGNDTNYPAARGQYIRFTLDTTPTDSDIEQVTFQNILYWGPSTTVIGSFNEATIEALSGSAISSSFTTNRSVNAGASNYVTYAIPNYTDLTGGTDYETDGNRGTSFKFNGVTCAFSSKATVASVTNADGYDEAYEVYQSIETNLGNSTLEISTGTGAENTIYWGYHTDTDADAGTVEGLSGGGSANNNTRARTFTVTTGASQFTWYCYPKRLGTSTFKDDDTQLPLGMYASSPQTVSVTNLNGWTEDYYCYRTEFANLGELNVLVE